MSPVETAARIVAVDGCRPAARDDFRIAAERVPPLRTTPAHVFPRQQISDPCRLAVGRIVQQGIAARFVTDQKLAARTSRQLQSGARSSRIRHPPRDGRHSVRLLRPEANTGMTDTAPPVLETMQRETTTAAASRSNSEKISFRWTFLESLIGGGFRHRNTYRDKGSKFRNHPESREVRANRESGRDRRTGRNRRRREH